MIKRIAVLVLLVAAITWAICPEPPEPTVPFEYDPNLIAYPLVDAWEITAGEPNAWAFGACDDENDVYAFVFTALPDNVTIEPNDWLNWAKYVDANEQQEYILRWTPDEQQEGTHYISFFAMDKRHRDPNSWDARTIVARVSLPPNNPPVIQPPRPFAE